ncbi:hypothetical protein EOM81_11525 [bacterium]|nr:hypothetical protein [bacterium]
MLTKKEFTDAMTAIVDQLEEDKRLSGALNIVVNRNYGMCHYDTAYALPGLVKLLATVMKDKNSWIEYWLYELECGAKYRTGSITQDGKPIKLKTIADLYALLKKECRNKK